MALGVADGAQRGRAFSLAVVVLSFLAWIPLSAEAQQQSVEEKRAKAHFVTGQKMVERKQWEAAYEEFLAGYQLSKKPLFVFNMAECARELGKNEQALSDYKTYLRDDPQGPMVELAQERLDELNASVVSDQVEQEEQEREAEIESVLVDEEAEEDGSFFESPPFWIGVGVAVAAIATVSIIAVSSGGERACGMGCFDLR